MSGPPIGARDVRAEVARITRERSVDLTARAVFLERRASMAEAFHAESSADVQARDRGLRTLAQAAGVPHLTDARAIRAAMKPPTPAPVPGGVGEGFYYATAGSPAIFIDGFVGGTAIGFDLIAQTAPGGNVDNYLYLTATNRSGLGVEAFLSYFGQTEPDFKVFEWALYSGDPWVVDLPWSALTDYLHLRTTHGMSLPVIPVWNSTFRVDGSTWRNEVHLHNARLKGWDLIYSFDYAAVDADQQQPTIGGTFTGTWGPIVETFQDPYVGTVALGHLAIQLCAADTDLVWSDWAQTSDANMIVVGPDLGFTELFRDDQYAFVVVS